MPNEQARFDQDDEFAGKRSHELRKDKSYKELNKKRKESKIRQGIEKYYTANCGEDKNIPFDDFDDFDDFDGFDDFDESDNYSYH